MELLVDKLNMV